MVDPANGPFAGSVVSVKRNPFHRPCCFQFTSLRVYVVKSNRSSLRRKLRPGIEPNRTRFVGSAVFGSSVRTEKISVRFFGSVRFDVEPIVGSTRLNRNRTEPTFFSTPPLAKTLFLGGFPGNYEPKTNRTDGSSVRTDEPKTSNRVEPTAGSVRRTLNRTEPAKLVSGGGGFSTAEISATYARMLNFHKFAG